MPVPASGRRSALALLLGALVLSCGSPSEPRKLPVDRVEIDAPASSLAEDEQLTLGARALDRNGVLLPDASIAWSASPASVATISAEGVLTGVDRGTANVTATAGSVSATKTMTVTPAPVTAIDLQPRQADGTIGTPLPLTITLTDRRGRAVTDRAPTFTVVPIDAATVRSQVIGGVPTYTLTAVVRAPVVVTARIDGVSVVGNFSFDGRPVATVSLEPKTLIVPLNTSTHRLTAAAKDDQGTILTGHLFTWTSSDASVATVSSNGTIVPVAVGVATIAATSPNGIAASSGVTVVRNPVAAITLLPNTLALDRGASRAIQAIVDDSVGNRVSPTVLAWTSTDPTIASVSATGAITGVSSGTATVSAAADERSAAVSVVVREPPPVASVILTPDRFTLSPGQALPLQTTALSAAGETLVGHVTTYASATPGLVAVSSSGRVTALAPGNATVTATVEGRSASLALTVLPTQVASQFDMEVRYLSAVPPRVRQAVEAAVNRLRHAIAGDVPNIQVSLSANECFAGSPPINEVIDDILVYVDVAPLAGFAGFSSACWVRTQGGLPIVSYVRINTNELARMESQGWLDQLILHELGHAIGLLEFIWTRQGLTQGIGTSSPVFRGTRATQAFAAVGGTPAGAFLPLENEGVIGTIHTHWRYAVMRPELMSSFITVGLPSPLSQVTLGALGDMGYTINPDAWDAFRVLSGGSTTAALAMQAFADDVGTPVGSIDARGRKSYFAK